jgi:pyruvate dehydrogenase E1 component beta subunit
MAEITFRDALRQALREEMERDPRVFVMGEEVGRFEGSYKVTRGLFEEFGPQRVREAPIAEEGFTGVGIGAAMLGLRPVVEIMTLNFILVAMDMVINHAAKVRYMFGGELKVPLVIRTPGGAGSQLTAQHSQSFEVWFANTPGLKVLAPANPRDAKGLLKSAIRDDDPVLFVENLIIYNERGDVPDGDYTTPIGLADIPRKGSDLTIVSHSYATVRALKVAQRLAEDGIDAEVVDLRSLRPLDMETVVQSVNKTHRALCVEEGWPTYGLSAEIAARIQRACFSELDAPVERVGGAEVPMPYAKPLERSAQVNEEKIYLAARQVLAESGMLTRGVGRPPGSAASGSGSGNGLVPAGTAASAVAG